MPERSIEDHLRAEYFELLPDIRLVLDELETEVNHCLLPIKRQLCTHERINVTSRPKECESAIDALRRREKGNVFDPEQASEYTLTKLRDLAAVQVLVFPRSRLTEVSDALRLCELFREWESDPIIDREDRSKILAEKFHGHCRASRRVRGEYQVVPMLLGLFWQVEHDAIYKPSPQLRGIARSLEMSGRTSAVYVALEEFEAAFDTMLQGTLGDRSQHK